MSIGSAPFAAMRHVLRSRARGFASEVARREAVAEVRGRGDRPAVARHRVDPHAGTSEELLGRDQDEVGPEDDRAEEHPDQAHVVEQREPGDEDVAFGVHAGHLAGGLHVAMGGGG